MPETELTSVSAIQRHHGQPNHPPSSPQRQQQHPTQQYQQQSPQQQSQQQHRKQISPHQRSQRQEQSSSSLRKYHFSFKSPSSQLNSTRDNLADLYPSWSEPPFSENDRYKGPNLYTKWKDPRVLINVSILIVLLFTLTCICISKFSTIALISTKPGQLSLLSKYGWSLQAQFNQFILFLFLGVIHFMDALHIHTIYPLRSTRRYTQVGNTNIIAVMYGVLFCIVFFHVVFWTISQKELNADNIYIGENTASWIQVFNVVSGFGQLLYLACLLISCVFTYNMIGDIPVITDTNVAKNANDDSGDNNSNRKEVTCDDDVNNAKTGGINLNRNSRSSSFSMTMNNTVRNHNSNDDSCGNYDDDGDDIDIRSDLNSLRSHNSNNNNNNNSNNISNVSNNSNNSNNNNNMSNVNVDDYDFSSMEFAPN